MFLALRFHLFFTETEVFKQSNLFKIIVEVLKDV